MANEPLRGTSQQNALPPARLHSLAEAELGDVVGRLLDSSGLAIGDWHSHLLHGGVGVPTGGVYRLFGTANVGSGECPWSVVLKLARPAGLSAHDPAHYNYWRREWCVYAASDGLLPSPDEGLVAPRCFGAGEDADGSWLWLEDIIETVPRPWSMAQYGLAARHIGCYNGRFLIDRPVPSYPWLATSVVRSYIAGYASQWTRLVELPTSSLGRRGWPLEQIERMRRQWEERDWLLAAEALLPRTVCHGDPVDRNLLARVRADGVQQTVAIDWAFAGVGAVGQDPVSLLQSVLREPAADFAADLDKVLETGYLEGLESAGWHGDPRLARLGFTVAAVMRYGLNPVAGGLLSALTDDDARQKIELGLALAYEDLLDGVVRLRGHCLGLADEARSLWRSLSAQSG